MSKKLTGLALGAMLLALSFPADAQQTKKVPRIGFVSGTGANNPNIEAFRQGLRDLGYVEGKTILVEYRYAEGKLDRVPGLVADLVQLKVDVVVCGVLPAIHAAKEATKTIPIVMVTTQDPVAVGLVDSLARPGGNITGLTTLSRELSWETAGIAYGMVPRISRVGVLWDANAPGPAISFKEYEAAARALKNPASILRGTRSEPRFGGRISSRGQRARNWAHHDYESRAQPLPKADRGACH